MGLIIVIGQVPQKKSQKLRIFMQKFVRECSRNQPRKGEGPRIRQRELNQDPVVIEASAHPTGSSGAGRALDSCSH